MDVLFNSLSDAQLQCASAAIDAIILKRKKKQQTQGCHILISGLDTSEGHEVIHDRLVCELENIRSRKIYVDVMRNTAKLTFKNAILANNAKLLLDSIYEEVKVY